MTRCLRLVLVRHGETVGPSSVRYFGRTDVALSEEGRTQMRQVGAALARERFDRVYTSTLVRTAEAAELIAPGVPHERHAGFDEVNFGRWEGWTREEIERDDPDLFRRWRADPSAFTYPDGDAAPAFRARVTEALHALLPEMPARALVIAHRGVVSAILADLLRLDDEARAALPIGLASVHVLEHGNPSWRAVALDQTQHLEGAP